MHKAVGVSASDARLVHDIVRARRLVLDSVGGVETGYFIAGDVLLDHTLLLLKHDASRLRSLACAHATPAHH